MDHQMRSWFVNRPATWSSGIQAQSASLASPNGGGGRVLGLDHPATPPREALGRWKTAMNTGETRYGAGQLLALPALYKDGRPISIEFSIQLLRNASGQSSG